MLTVAELMAKAVAWVSRRILRRGGETWPGEIALIVDPGIAEKLAGLFSSVIFVVGTNGKTSTAKLAAEVFRKAGHRVISNPSGANLMNGLVSNILVQKDLFQKAGYIGIFEVDEYTLPKAVTALKPAHIIFLNLFRDQLDRYGEVGNILARFSEALGKSPETVVVANGFDPSLHYLTHDLDRKRVCYFRVPSKFLKEESGVLGDSTYCPSCRRKLAYDGVYLGHLGRWRCAHCGLKPREGYTYGPAVLKRYQDLPDYTLINSQAVLILSRLYGVDEKLFFRALSEWQPAFGRGESVTRHGTVYAFYLGKNPASWTVALDNLKPEGLLVLGLNNRVPDGHDVSWIWDIHMPKLREKWARLAVFGDRALDMAVRLKAEGMAEPQVLSNVRDIGKIGRKYKQVAVLANYSATLEARSAIQGRPIL